MTTNQVACLGQYQACALRAARLDQFCTPLGADGDIVVTSGLVTLTATPDREEGTRYEQKTGCGIYAFTAVGEDIIKRYTIDAQFVLWDYELVEILTGSPLITGAAGGTWPNKTIGFASKGFDVVAFPGASLEIFTRTSGSGGACGPPGENPQFVRHIFPRAKLYLGEVTFEDAVAILRLTGTSEANSEWGEGPVPDEWESDDPFPENSPYGQVLATALPTTGCGYVTTT